MNTEALLRTAADGSQESLESLLRRYQPWMLQIVQREAGTRLLLFAEAEEIVQHAMTNAFRSIPTLDLRTDPQRQFESWLGTVTRNAVRYHGRKRRAAFKRLADDVAATVGDSGPSPSSLGRRRERFERLAEAVAQLPPSYQQVVVLQLNGRSLQEIADLLGLTKSAVNSRLDRARSRLHALLGSTSENLPSK